MRIEYCLVRVACTLVFFFFLQSLRDLKLLPFDADEVEAKLANFRQLSDEIRHNLSDILLAAMNLLYGGYKEAK